MYHLRLYCSLFLLAFVSMLYGQGIKLSSGITLKMSGQVSLVVNGNLDLETGATLVTSGDVFVSSIFNKFGTFDAGTSNFNFNGSPGQINSNTAGATFDVLSVVPGSTLTIESGKIINTNNLILSGTMANPITINSSIASQQATLSQASGTVNASYANIRDIIASGGATFNAFNSTDLGNNIGWNFTPDLIAFYPFTGNANDESGNGNDGMVNGATLTSDRFGNANSAYSFDGIDDQITVNLAAPATAFTFTAWINYKDADVSGFHVILEFGQDDPFFGIVAGNLAVFGAVQDDQQLAQNQWVFVAATYAPTTSILYIDGVNVESANFAPSLIGTNLGIGFNGSDKPFEGDIDDVRIYDRALTAMEILAIYNLEPPPVVTYATSPDISTATFSGTTISVAAQDTGPSDLAFNNDGTKMYLLGLAGDAVYEYALSTAFDVSAASFTTSFSVAAQETGPLGLAFNHDGTKMYVVGFVEDNVNEYVLSTAFNVSSASFSTNFSVAAQDGNPRGLAFNNDGTKMYVVGGVGDAVYEYALSTAFDVSTASFTTSFSVTAQDTGPTGLAFNNDGTKMYVVGGIGDAVYEYALSTAFDVSTASFTTSFSVTAQDTVPNGLAFNNDGTKMYVMGNIGNEINVYDLSSNAFNEVPINDGSVEGSLIVSIINDTFTGGTLTSPTHFTINNLPAGLVPTMAVSTDGLTATLTLAGNATANENVNDVNDLQFTFTNAAFTNSTASIVNNAIAASSNLGIDFNDFICTVFPVISNKITNNTACNPLLSNGSISASNGGVIAGNTFEWFTGTGTTTTFVDNTDGVISGASGETISGLAPGNFTVRVTVNATGCASTQTFAVLDNATIPVIDQTKVIISDLTSCSSLNGSLAATDALVVSDSGGEPVGGYTFEWWIGTTVTGAADFTGGTYSNLDAGDYTLVATNNDTGCGSAPVTITISDNTIFPAVNVVGTDATDCQSSDGQLTASAQDNVGPLLTGVTFEWFVGSDTSTPFVDNTDGVISGTNGEIISGLIPGAYTVKVTIIASGCSNTSTMIVSNLCVLNQDPTDIALSSQTVNEEQAIGLEVGTLSTTDADAGDTHTYSRVTGTGDSDNASFSITGNQLLTAEVFDFETKTSYSVRIQTDDGNGGTFQKSFTITIININEVGNNDPTDITLSSQSIDEEVAIGTEVGTMITTDVDAGDTHTYTRVTGTGDTDNASFSIIGNQLLTAEVFDFETKSSYSIRIQTDDDNGGTFPKVFIITINDTTEPVDTENPMITNESLPIEINKGDGQINASITATDNSGTVTVNFHYKEVNKSDFTNILAVSANGQNYELTIMESWLNDAGIDYFFHAEDLSGNFVTTDTTTLALVIPDGTAPDIENVLGQGGNRSDWRMFSIPYELLEKSIFSIFETAIGSPNGGIDWRILHWDPVRDNFKAYQESAFGFPPLDMIERGKGYWFLSRANISSLLAGASNGKVIDTKNLFSMALKEGWNQVGNPYPFTMSWDAVRTTNGFDNTQIGDLVVFSGSQDTLVAAVNNQIQAFQGAYVEVLSNVGDVNLSIPIVTGSRTSQENEVPWGLDGLDQAEWQVALTLNAPGFSNQLGGIGMRPDASIGMDEFDRTKLPLIYGFPQLSFSSNTGQRSLTRSIIERQESYHWVFNIEAIDGTLASLTWENHHFGINDFELMLFDPANSRVINMREYQEYQFIVTGSSKLEIYYGDNNYILEELGAKAVVLGNNYPNPLNDKTIIPFSLPNTYSTYQVKISLIGLDGRYLETISQGYYPPGFHKIEWRIDSDTGIVLKSGVYLYRIDVQADNYHQEFTKTLILNR